MTDPEATPMPASENAGETLGEAAGEAGQTPPRQGIPMPKVTFTTFAMSIASSALVHLGEVPEPETGKTTVDLHLAKHSIDILTMLHDKTKGNLDEAEARLLTEILYEARMKFVLKSR